MGLQTPVKWALNHAVPPKITVDVISGQSGVPIAIFGPFADLPAVTPARNRAGTSQRLAGPLRRRRVHANLCHQVSRLGALCGSLSARRLAVRQAGRLELPAAAVARCSPSTTGDASHRRRHQVARITACDDLPLGDLEWVERERSGQVVFGATMVAAEPVAAVAARAAILEQLTALEARRVASVVGFEIRVSRSRRISATIASTVINAPMIRRPEAFIQLPVSSKIAMASRDCDTALARDASQCALHCFIPSASICVGCISTWFRRLQAPGPLVDSNENAIEVEFRR